MTKLDAIRLVEEIRFASGDYKEAHGKEDASREAFLRFVAEKGPRRLREVAEILLTTNDIDFPRYCV